jgi:hypothetical protein
MKKEYHKPVYPYYRPAGRIARRFNAQPRPYSRETYGANNSLYNKELAVFPSYRRRPARSFGGVPAQTSGR